MMNAGCYHRGMIILPIFKYSKKRVVNNGVCFVNGSLLLTGRLVRPGETPIFGGKVHEAVGGLSVGRVGAVLPRGGVEHSEDV